MNKRLIFRKMHFFGAIMNSRTMYALYTDANIIRARTIGKSHHSSRVAMHRSGKFPESERRVVPDLLRPGG